MSVEGNDSVKTSPGEKYLAERQSSENDRTESTFIIDPEKEKRIVRKFDMLVLPQFMLMVILAHLDRTNIGNARIFGFEEDLNLEGNDFANISSFFYITYVIFEIPWVVAIKHLGANSVIAVGIVTWSAVTIGTGFIHNYHQALACRLLLGICEAGLVPGLTFLLATMYPRHSQGKRVAAIYASTALSGAFGGLIAWGIQKMGDRHGLSAWRWLFIVEGIISMVLGALSWMSMPKNAQQAWFLTPEEKELTTKRNEHDTLNSSSRKFSWVYAKLAFTDPVVWIAALSMFCGGIPLYGFAVFLPTIISGMGFESIQVNYLTIPVYIVACLALLGFTYVSDRLRKRAIVAICVPVVVVTGYAIAIGTDNIGAGYFAMFVCSSVYTFNTIVLAWASNNVYPDNKRSVAIPFILSIANVSGIAAGQVYPNYTAPRFIMGNAVSLGMEFVAGSGIGAICLILRRRNQIKAKQIAGGTRDNGALDDMSLDFQYMF